METRTLIHKHLAGSHKVRNKLTLQATISLLGIYSREKKTYICLHKHLYANSIHKIFLNWKQPKCPSTGEHIILWYPYNEMSRAIETTDIGNNMIESRKHCAKWKSQTQKGKILYDSIYMKLWNSQNYGDRNSISSCQGLGVAEGD